MVEKAAEAAEAAQREAAQWKEKISQTTNKIAQLEQKVSVYLPLTAETVGSQGRSPENEGGPYAVPPLATSRHPCHSTDCCDLVGNFHSGSLAGVQFGVGEQEADAGSGPRGGGGCASVKGAGRERLKRVEGPPRADHRPSGPGVQMR